jgi:MYXO-CTERM domain-containing protein
LITMQSMVFAVRRPSRAVLLLIAALAAPRASAQGWNWLSPLPQGIAVNAVSFAGSQAWMVGAQGSIVTTTDLGQTFTSQKAPTIADLFGVFFLPSGMDGWAVGAAGTILHTANGGQTWTAQNSQSSRKLNGVVFTDSQHGYAVGDYRTLLVTSDGGQSWGGLDGQLLSLNAITATDANHIYAVGDSGGILVSTDGGSTFNVVSTPTSNHLLAVAFTDAMHGYAVGAAGTLLVSSDGGQSWSQVPAVGSVNPPDLVAVTSISTTKVFLMGANGEVSASSDGATFSPVVVNLPHVGTLTSLVSDSVGNLVAATDQGQVLLSPPPSAITPSFADVNTALPRASDVTSVSFGSALTGLVVQGNQLLRTDDGGKTFTPVGPVLGMGQPPPQWNAVAMPTAMDAYVVGANGAWASSHDSGQTWTFGFPPGVAGDLLAVSFVDGQNGYAVGTGGVIVSTRNGGAGFTVVYPTSVDLYAIAFFDPFHGVVAGQYGFVLYTVDGTSWIVSTATNGLSNILGAAVVTPSTVYVSGQGGLLAVSRDQGQTFNTIASPSNDDLTAIVFRDRQVGYVTTSNVANASGSIFITHDGALSFTSQFNGGPLTALSFGDSLHGFAGGVTGTLLGTQTAGEPSCQTTADCPVDPKGVLGYVCTSGACVPCTTNDSCTAACIACVSPNQFCYTGYCGNCISSGGCIAPAQCVLGVCQMPLPFDAGMDAGPLPDAGRDAGILDAGHPDSGQGHDAGPTDGGLADGGAGSSGCGCATSPGTAAEIAVLGLVLLAIFPPLRRRER